MIENKLFVSFCAAVENPVTLAHRLACLPLGQHRSSLIRCACIGNAPLDWFCDVTNQGEATSMQTKWIKLDLGPAGFVLKSRSIPKFLWLWLITSSVRFRTLIKGGLTVCTITPAIPNNYSLYFSLSFLDLIGY